MMILPPAIRIKYLVERILTSSSISMGYGVNKCSRFLTRAKKASSIMNNLFMESKCWLKEVSKIDPGSFSNSMISKVRAESHTTNFSKW